MTRSRSKWTLCCLAAALCTAPALAQIGPDVILIDIFDTAHYGPAGSYHGYAIGTRSCNIGDQNALWQSWNTMHPVIGMNLYRLKDGRLQQIGLSWLKHSFTTIDSGFCPGTCTATGSVLGVGCADPYWATLNGDTSRLGPRYQVNAATGEFIYPYDNSAPIVDASSRRIRVHDDDVNPALNTGALYFVEGQYVTFDDASWDNNENNTSHRQTTVGAGASRPLNLTGPTHDTIPVIFAWQDNDANVDIATIDVPADGRMFLAALATDLGGGIWHYEYAIENITSDRNAASLSIPIPLGANVTNMGFADADYHSGEPFDGTDWNMSAAGGLATFNAPQTHAQNPFASAVRWGKLANFWFDIDAAPASGDVTVGLFTPGSPSSMTVPTVVPTKGGGGAVDAPLKNYNVLTGIPVSGDLASMDDSDDSYLVVDGVSIATNKWGAETVVTATSPLTTVSQLDAVFETDTNRTKVVTKIFLNDRDATTYVQLDKFVQPRTDTVSSYPNIANPNAYVRDSDGLIRVKIFARRGAVNNFEYRIDHVQFTVTP